MNIDRGKESFTADEIAELQAHVVEMKAERDLSWAEMSKMMGIPVGTLSVWAKGNYGGDNVRVAYEVNRYLLTEQDRQRLELEAPIIPGFQPTTTSRKIHAQLRWAQRGKISVITGESGVGKTASLAQYAATTSNVYMATMAEGASAPSAMLAEILRGMGFHGQRSGGMGGVQALSYMIIDRVDGRSALLILDEAQYLSNQALNQLRFIHDKVGVGVALCGNTEIMGRITARGRGGSAPFAQLHSRISMPAHYSKPDDADVNTILNAWRVERPEQRQFLAKIAAMPGCLRQLTQTLEAATLIARQSDEDLTLSHLQAAFAQQHRPLGA